MHARLPLTPPSLLYLVISRYSISVVSKRQNVTSRNRVFGESRRGAEVLVIIQSSRSKTNADVTGETWPDPSRGEQRYIHFSTHHLLHLILPPRLEGRVTCRDNEVVHRHFTITLSSFYSYFSFVSLTHGPRT